MSEYAIAITHADHTPSIVKLLRGFSEESISVLIRRIGTTEPVVHVDTQDFSLEMSDEDGVLSQQKRLLNLVQVLESSGASVRITHHVGEIVEPLSLQMLRNLFESELIDLAQEHD